jgi:hypothetical protein
MEPTCFGLTTLMQIVLKKKDHPPPYNMSCDWWWGLRKTQRKKKTCRFLHDENFCLPEPHYHATKIPKQLIYNYITTRTWEYK